MGWAPTETGVGFEGFPPITVVESSLAPPTAPGASDFRSAGVGQGFSATATAAEAAAADGGPSFPAAEVEGFLASRGAMDAGGGCDPL